jgi:hypothetical protein
VGIQTSRIYPDLLCPINQSLTWQSFFLISDPEKNGQSRVKNKRGKLWMWKALDRDTGQLLDWECGRRDKRALKKMVDRLTQWDVKMYCTDK